MSNLHGQAGGLSGPSQVTEREITYPTDLTLGSGRLNPEAVGWTRTQQINTDGIGRGLIGKGRNKRWEYWAILTPRHIVALVASDIDYAAVPSIWVLDRESGKTYASDEIAFSKSQVELPGTLDSGPSRVNLESVKIAIDPVREPHTLADRREAASATRLRAIGPGVRVDVLAHKLPGHEALGVVVPWSQVLFQYTVKDVALPASGSLWIEGERFDLPEDSWAILDHGRGRWPYDIMWNWGAGCGISAGHTVGIQVGAKWTDGTGTVENSVYVDGHLTKISEELVWEYDPSDWMKPWRVWGTDIDVTLTPEHLKSSRMDLKILAGRTDQVFGTWSGWFRDARGEMYEVTDIMGFAEEVHNRW